LRIKEQETRLTLQEHDDDDDDDDDEVQSIKFWTFGSMKISILCVIKAHM